MDRILKFQYGGREYKMEFPTIGQYMDIETKKMELSKGKLGDLIAARTISSLRTVQCIECISLLQVLCPSILGDIKVLSLEEIDAKDFVSILKLYSETILPWYSTWFKEFNDALIDIQEDSKKIEEENK